MDKKIGLIMGLGLTIISMLGFSNINKVNNIDTSYSQSKTEQQETLSYKIWKRSDEMTFYDFSNGTWIMLDYLNQEYIYCDINEEEHYFYNIDNFKSYLDIELKNTTIVGQGYNSTEENEKYFNPYNYTQVNYELDKLPADIKNLLIENNIQFAYKNIESQNKNEKIYGQYYWDDNLIIIDKDDFSIEYAFIHEIGHALDDIYNISANKTLIQCYNNKEITFTDVENNEYFYSEIREYVAQAIQEYYNNTLDKNSNTYKELDKILNNI